MGVPFIVLWWIEAGHVPTVNEAKDRLERLQRDGPSPFAFTFLSPFPAPGTSEGVELDDRWTCPTG